MAIISPFLSFPIPFHSLLPLFPLLLRQSFLPSLSLSSSIHPMMVRCTHSLHTDTRVEKTRKITDLDRSRRCRNRFLTLSSALTLLTNLSLHRFGQNTNSLPDLTHVALELTWN